MAGENDPVGVALSGIGAGATAGASVITVSLIVLRLMLGGADGGLSQDLQFAVITAGLIGGVITAFLTTFTLARTITDLWRRAALAATTVFLAAFLAALATPVDMLTGVPGLSVYLAVLGTATWYSAAKAKAAAAE